MKSQVRAMINRRRKNKVRSSRHSQPQVRKSHITVKTAKGRKISSSRWLERQLNDPFVELAKKEGFRSRAAYKLIQLNQRFDILKPDMTVIDLGAAPGGWSQVVAKTIRSEQFGGRGRLLSVDLRYIDPIPGAEIIEKDFMLKETKDFLKSSLKTGADIVLSDISPPLTGHKKTDHIRIISTAESVYDFAYSILKPEGGCIAKVFQGGTEQSLLNHFKASFRSVKHAKPRSSRPESAELYIVAQGFRHQK